MPLAPYQNLRIVEPVENEDVFINFSLLDFGDWWEKTIWTSAAQTKFENVKHVSNKWSSKKEGEETNKWSSKKEGEETKRSLKSLQDFTLYSHGNTGYGVSCPGIHKLERLTYS